MRQKRKKHNKKEDQHLFFKLSAGCYLFGTFLSLAAGKWMGRGNIHTVSGVGTLLAFLAGTLFLGFASTDGTEFFLAEPWESVSEEVMEDLKKRLAEAHQRIEQEKKKEK